MTKKVQDIVLTFPLYSLYILPERTGEKKRKSRVYFNVLYYGNNAIWKSEDLYYILKWLSVLEKPKEHNSVMNQPPTTAPFKLSELPTRPGYGQIGRPVRVRTNFFEVLNLPGIFWNTCWHYLFIVELDL